METSARKQEKISGLALIFLIFSFSVWTLQEKSHLASSDLQILSLTAPLSPIYQISINCDDSVLARKTWEGFIQPEVLTHFLLVDLASGVKISITEAEF